MPVLSIIVPVYKVEKYIHKCVDSILNQTFTDFELILVDDGTPDSCGKICDEYAAKDKRVKVIHKENGGVSSARNIALDCAAGEYISFVDPDDWIDVDLYNEVLNIFVNDKGISIVCFEVCEVRNDKSKIKYLFDKDENMTGGVALTRILTDVIDNSPCNKVYKKSLWNEVRFPVGRRFEDVATIYKTFAKANKVYYKRKAYYYYLKREGSAIALSFDAQRRYECFLGYKERYQFALYECLNAAEKCKMFAVKAAISAITAESAGCGHITDSYKAELYTFCNDNKNVSFLSTKNKVLLWGINNCNLINKMYGMVSYWSKKLK